MPKEKIVFATPYLKFGGKDHSSGNIKYFKTIDKYAKSKGLQLVLFKPSEFNLESGLCINATTMQYGKLKLSEQIRPEVLYFKQLKNLDRFTESINQYQIKLLNPAKLKSICVNKKDTNTCLSKSSELVKYLIPELEINRSSSKNDLVEFIKAVEHPFYILKPVSGQGGIGIEKLSLRQLKKNLAEISGKKGYLLQPFIEGELMFRCLTYSVNGVAKLSGSYARVPKYPSGGLFAGDRRNYKLQAPKELAEAATKINAQITKSAGCLESFIAIDFLIDSSGKTWLLEVNSNPGFVRAYQNRKLAKAYAKALIEPALSLVKRA
jgi:glutathione synthase/RimK-type ligase-like ATP-grasp enzyme